MKAKQKIFTDGLYHAIDPHHLAMIATERKPSRLILAQHIFDISYTVLVRTLSISLVLYYSIAIEEEETIARYGFVPGTWPSVPAVAE